MLRPFPSLWLLAATPPGRAGHEGPATRSFPRVSGLSLLSAVYPGCLHRFCCRVAVDRPRVPLPVAMTLYRLTRSGGESEIVRIGVSLGAPFLESGQLRSHDTPTAIGVETDQPRGWPLPGGLGACGCQVLGCQESASPRVPGVQDRASVGSGVAHRRRCRDMARWASRSASRWVMA